MNDTLGRILRGLLQLVAGGALSPLFDQIAKDIDPRLSPYVLLFSVFLVITTQDVLESLGWIPALLKPAGAKALKVETVQNEANEAKHQ